MWVPGLDQCQLTYPILHPLWIEPDRPSSRRGHDDATISGFQSPCSEGVLLVSLKRTDCLISRHRTGEIKPRPFGSNMPRWRFHLVAQPQRISLSRNQPVSEPSRQVSDGIFTGRPLPAAVSRMSNSVCCRTRGVACVNDPSATAAWRGPGDWTRWRMHRLGECDYRTARDFLAGTMNRQDAFRGSRNRWPTQATDVAHVRSP